MQVVGGSSEKGSRVSRVYWSTHSGSLLLGGGGVGWSSRMWDLGCMVRVQDWSERMEGEEVN